MGNYAAAIASLNGSFVNTASPLEFGAYHAFSTESGDVDNQLFDPQGRAILAHPSILTDAQPRADGSRDLRATTKVTTLAEPRTVQGVTTDLLFTIYDSPEASVPIIRNEELILLRAEARYNTGDIPGALADINFIRQTSGGLPALTGFANAAAFTDELLYNRRYSLLFEGGHRWIDARRYSRLSTLPLALSTHTVPSRFPYPEGECLARDPAPAQGC
jgi:starch-binding outer membrane protein, SusD/RagB family